MNDQFHYRTDQISASHGVYRNHSANHIDQFSNITLNLGEGDASRFALCIENKRDSMREARHERPKYAATSALDTIPVDSACCTLF